MVGISRLVTDGDQFSRGDGKLIHRNVHDLRAGGADLDAYGLRSRMAAGILGGESIRGSLRRGYLNAPRHCGPDVSHGRSEADRFRVLDAVAQHRLFPVRNAHLGGVKLRDPDG